MANLKDLTDKLTEVESLIDGVAPKSVQYYDLHILKLQIERQIEFSSFDALSDLDKVVLPDFTQLRALTDDLKKAIEDEKKRTALVGQIIGTVRKVAGIAGLNLPLL
jgi:hypothetical protein